MRRHEGSVRIRRIPPSILRYSRPDHGRGTVCVLSCPEQQAAHDGAGTMRKSRPLHWIEEAEAREFLIMALSERPRLLSPSPIHAQWINRIRGWFFGSNPPVAERRPLNSGGIRQAGPMPIAQDAGCQAHEQWVTSYDSPPQGDAAC
jgi:hypothetical protein